MEGAGPGLLLEGVAVAGLRVPQGEGPHGEALALPDDARLRDLFDDDLVVDVHVEGAPAGLDIVGQPGRPDYIEGLVPVHLAGEHEYARQARDVVGVHVRDEDRRDLLPPEVEAAYRDLGPLAAVEEEELPLAAEEDARERAVRQGHHAPRAEHEGF
jgi:hypothetical protein